VLQDSKDKSFLLNIMDTPGHANFRDEVVASLRIADGVAIVVDTTLGLSTSVERTLQLCIIERLPMVLILNQMDRFIVELRLPPSDAYHKIRHTIDEVNGFLAETAKTLNLEAPPEFVPQKGNVLFSSSQYSFMFTLDSFAALYAETHNNSFEAKRFAQNLWGDVYFNEESRKFQDKSEEADQPRTFVQFILEPLYKLFAHTIGEERESLTQTLGQLGIYLSKKQYQMNIKDLFRTVCQTFFGDPTSFVDVVSTHLPSPAENARQKCLSTYSGSQKGVVAKNIGLCDPQGPLMVNTVKNYHQPDCMTFDSFGRVFSGTICKGDRIKVLGEAFSLDDDEDMSVKVVEHLWIYQGRYRVEVSHVPAGNWCLIGGVDGAVLKTSTITTAQNDEEVEIFRPLRFNMPSVIKVACEPLNPSELPKMVEGLRKIERAYPLAVSKVEESGEHVILGTGELFLDCALYDLRNLYGNLEIKVVDPVVSFNETVVETSSLKCFAETPNKKNKLYVVGEPLEKGIGEDIEANRVRTDMDKKQISEFFTTKYEWDLLASRSIWSFGPEVNGPNILVDDTLPSEVDKKLLFSTKQSVVQGFQWATREGPLCEEAMRNTKFKILDCDLAADPVARGGGQVIPTARRVVHSAFLMATPRVMEPVLFTEIECPADCVSAIYQVLSRRRGNVLKDAPKAGNPMYMVHAYVPAVEAFGLETDVRTHTSGQSYCMTQFDHWDLVPGDPLDKSIILRPLEPAPYPHLAREFMVKTRRRKGMAEDVAVQKFFDEPMLQELARQDAELQQYF